MELILKFYYPMNLHYSKTSKREYLKLLPVYVSQGIQLHFIISRPFFQKKHIDYHTCASLFNYPAILHLFRPSKRHLKLLPAQKSHKYTTPKPQKRIFEAATSAYITRLFNYILSYRHPFVKNILTTIFVQVCSTTLQFCTSSNA